MTGASPLGEYIARRGPLHRVTPGVKLIGLFVFAIAIMAVSGTIWTTCGLAIAVAAAIVAGLRGPDFWRVARRFAVIAVPLLVFTATSAAFGRDGGWGPAGLELPGPAAWAAGFSRGYSVIGDLFALVLVASAVTASTAVEDMLDTITRALAPLRRFGAKPERVALAFSLVIRAIPSILGIAHETAAAARARGLERDPRARVVPLVLRTVAHAQVTGEALAARGIGEE